MSTVIDSLLIELGLDSSKFNSGQKKAVEQLQKFDEANTKSNKNATQGAKELDLNLGKIRNSLMHATLTHGARLPRSSAVTPRVCRLRFRRLKVGWLNSHLAAVAKKL